MNDLNEPTGEPRHVRVARAIMDLLTPDGIDSILLGLAVGLGFGVAAVLWWFGQ